MPVTCQKLAPLVIQKSDWSILNTTWSALIVQRFQKGYRCDLGLLLLIDWFWDMIRILVPPNLGIFQIDVKWREISFFFSNNWNYCSGPTGHTDHLFYSYLFSIRDANAIRRVCPNCSQMLQWSKRQTANKGAGSIFATYHVINSKSCRKNELKFPSWFLCRPTE